MAETRTIELRNGQSAQVLVDIADITERHRRLMQRASQGISPEGWVAIDRLQNDDAFAKTPGSISTVPEDDMDRLSALNDAAVLAMLRSWTLPEPLTIEAIQGVAAPDYDVLRSETAYAAKAIFTDFSPSPDEQSPTRPSSASRKR
jgi:hypothetical protein